MGYLYGDATPFPLDENFIETLVAVTKSCVELFKAENAAENRNQQARDARAMAEVELARLNQLKQTVDGALARFLSSSGADAAELAAGQIAQASQSSVQSAIDKVTSTRDSSIRTALSVNIAAQIRTAMGLFAIKFSLPDTVWGTSWKCMPSSELCEAKIKSVSPHGIQCLYTATIPTGTFWASGIKVSDHAEELYLTMSKEPGLLGKKPRTHKEALHKLIITELNHTPGSHFFVVRPTTKKPSPGFKVFVRDSKRTSPSVVRVDENGQEVGSLEKLSGEGAAGVARLWANVERNISSLIGLRRTITSVRYGGKVKEDCDKPAALAEAILSTIAPIVLEMRKRSRVPGEMALKRDLGDGRREELFVPREKLMAMYQELPDLQRRIFEAIGLGGESTEEFQTGMLASPLPPRIPDSNAHELDHDEVTIEAGSPDDYSAA
jgi:hypothetical protein